MTQFLVGEHTKLVKFTERYVVAKYIDWLNDQRVNRFLCAGRKPLAMEDITMPNGNTEMRFAILSNLRSNEEKNVMVKGDEFAEYIGTISLNGIDWINRRAEVGYMIGQTSHWGCGIATEIIGLISDYAFNRLGLRKVEAGVVDGNVGSVKALEKNNFKKYGTVPQEYFLEGKYLDVHRFYKLQEW